MKHLKKFIVAALTMFVALAMAIPAFADEGTPSITINDKDPEGHTSTEYHYYQLLRATIDGDKVSYYLTNGTDDSLRGFLDAVTVDGNDLFTFTQSADGTRWNVTINKKADNTDYDDEDGAAIASALNTDAIKGAAIANDTFSQNGGTAVADNLDKGYYLVTSTLGTNLVVQTLNAVTIDTKNDYITNTKTASKTNMNVGDIVTYTVTVHVPASAIVGNEITVHDTLDEHLAIDASTIAAKLGTENVTLSDGTKKVDTETFAKKFTITEAMLDQDVTITYNAELLSTAADDTGYVNNAFSETNNYETNPVDVKVYTFDFDLTKTFAGETADTFTATFKLYPEVDGAQGSTAIQFVASTTDGVENYVKADSDDTGTTDTITAKNTKMLNVNGLAAGKYYLVEQTTEEGFNLLTEPAVITITDTSTAEAVSHNVTYTLGGTTGSNPVAIENNSGSVLPSTGGMGTTILYIIGGILVVGGGIYLLTKKRMGKE